MNDDFKEMLRMPSLRSTTLRFAGWLHDRVARALIRPPKPGKYNVIRLR